MVKKAVLIGLALLLSFSPFTSSNVLANVEHFNCSLTIDANVHTWGNFAEPTGECQGFIYGYFFSSSDGTKEYNILGSYTGPTYDGHVFDISLGTVGNATVTVKTIPLKPTEKPKPEEPKNDDPGDKPNDPKPQDPPSEPKTEPKDKPEDKPKDKPQDKPKTDPKDDSASDKPNTKTTEPKTKTDSNNQNKNQTTTPKNNSSGTTTNNKETTKEKEWTIQELKEANAKVIEENGRYFAIVESEKLKKEITLEEAIELGYKVEDTSTDDKEDSISIEDIAGQNQQEVKETTSNNIEKSTSKSAVLPILYGGIITAVILAGVIFFSPKGKMLYKAWLKKLTKKE